MDNYILKEINNDNLKEIFDYKWEENGNPLELINKDILKTLGLESMIIYCYDKIISDKVENLDVELDNILEARIFNETSELRLWKEDKEVKGSIFKEISDNSIYEELLLYPRVGNENNLKRLAVKKYIDYDNDGQAYISYIKPSKLF